MMTGSHPVVSTSRVRLVTGVTGGGHFDLQNTEAFLVHSFAFKGSSAEAQRVVGMALKRAWTLGSVWMATQGMYAGHLTSYDNAHASTYATLAWLQFLLTRGIC